MNSEAHPLILAIFVFVLGLGSCVEPCADRGDALRPSHAYGLEDR